MKKIITIILCSFMFSSVVAQQSKIENVSVKFSSSTDSLIVNYNVNGTKSLHNVKLYIRSEEGQQYIPRSITGDLGTVIPGIYKTIIWNMKADNVDLAEKTVVVKVTSKEFVPAELKKKTWIPWLYVASATSAGAGVFAHLRSKKLYKDYPPSSSTDEAEGIYADVDRMQNIRNVAFGAAGALGVAGVIVHIRHNQNQKAIALSYTNLHQGGLVGLTFKF
jgi:hypothetical protein